MMKKTILILFLLTTTSQLFSQELYDSILHELNTKYPSEKTYVQLDKNFYNPGETIWFKAYIKTEEPGTQISTSLYAEMITEKGSILERKTMPILLGGAASSFQLPDSIHSKIYLRVYTPWMLNFDSSMMYTKAINILEKNTQVRKEQATRYTLTFFPEGGDLVDGIESRIAFKTNDQDGKPFIIKGNILDAQGKTIREFNSVHNGMGFITLKPEGGQAYKAVWKDLAGKTQETALPAVRQNSATLSIVRDGISTFKYTITRSADVTDDMKEFIIIAQQRQQIVYAARINLKNKTAVTVPMPVDSLPDGIVQVTLFNKATLPVAERIVFVKNNNQYFITDLHMVEKNITKKGRNVLQLDIGGTLKSNLSIAVTDADLDIKTAATDNIYSQFFLSADLKGKVYDPAYYFSSDEDSVQNQLDLVMMTNGWRRFNWEKLLAGKMPSIKYMPESYLSVKGNVYGLTSTQINGRMLTGFLQSGKQGENSLFTAPVDKDGNFSIDQLYFFDTLKISYQFNGDKNKRLTDMASFAFKSNLLPSPAVNQQAITLLSFAPQPPKALALKSIAQNDSYKEIENSKKIKVLETVSVVAKKKSITDQLNEEYASGLFSGSNARIFAIENDPSAIAATSVLEYLRGRVAGLQISVSATGDGSVTRRGSNTDVFLDEMRTDIQLLQSIPMTQVAMIKVFDPPFFGAPGGGAGGAVAVYTKKGNSANANVKGLNTATVLGYSGIKEFYSPDYSTEESPLPDFRTTLYWNPFLLFSPQNKRISIPFYNSDNAKKIRVIIEGINELGQLTREEKVFE